jgi:hypothetical protein
MITSKPETKTIDHDKSWQDQEDQIECFYKVGSYRDTLGLPYGISLNKIKNPTESLHSSTTLIKIKITRQRKSLKRSTKLKLKICTQKSVHNATE